jgi:hypothetical protein
MGLSPFLCDGVVGLPNDDWVLEGSFSPLGETAEGSGLMLVSQRLRCK